MSTETTTSRRRYAGRALLAAILFLAVVPLLISRGNPYAEVIEDIAMANSWDADDIQMVSGTNTNISFLRWTRVQIIVRTATPDAPVHATVRKGPFSQARISCYSVGSSQPCAG